MEIDEIYNIIDSYENNNATYYNELLSIIVMLYYNDIPEFGLLLQKAEKEGKKLKIKEEELDDCWDSILLENLLVF